VRLTCGEPMRLNITRSLRACASAPLCPCWWDVDIVSETTMTCNYTYILSDLHSGPDLLLAGPCSEKNVGPLLYEYPPPDCFHPTRTVVIIDFLLRTRAAMHTTTAAAAVWQFKATQNRFLYSLIIISIFLACYHVAKKWKKNIFVLLWGPLFVGPLFGRTCWTCLNPPLSPLKPPHVHIFIWLMRNRWSSFGNSWGGAAAPFAPCWTLIKRGSD